MIMAKTRFGNRVISFILVLVILFAVVIGNPASAQAAVTLPVLGSIALALLVPTVLIGLGVYAAADSAGFDALCERVIKKIEQLRLLPLLVTSYIVEGVTHISDEVAKIIAEVANEESAYEPEKVSPSAYVDLPNYGRVYIFNIPTILTKAPLYVPGMVEVKNNLHLGTKITAGNIVYELYKRDSPAAGCTNYRVLSDYPNLHNGYNPAQFYMNAPYYKNPLYLLPLIIIYQPAPRPPCFITGFQYFDMNSYYPQWCVGTPVSVMDINLADYLSDKTICPSLWDTSPYLPSISADGKVQALPKVWADSVPIAGTDVLGLPITIPQDPAAAKDLTQDQVQAGSQSGAIDKPTDKPIEDVIDKTLQDMKTPPQLIEKFPFSIPFDVIRGIKLLAAPGVAPVFEIPLKVPEYGLDYTWRMDWSKFQEVISILRWGVYFVFLVSLAVGTKKLVWS